MQFIGDSFSQLQRCIVKLFLLKNEVILFKIVRIQLIMVLLNKIKKSTLFLIAIINENFITTSLCIYVYYEYYIVHKVIIHNK